MANVSESFATDQNEEVSSSSENVGHVIRGNERTELRHIAIITESSDHSNEALAVPKPHNMIAERNAPQLTERSRDAGPVEKAASSSTATVTESSSSSEFCVNDKSFVNEENRSQEERESQPSSSGFKMPTIQGIKFKTLSSATSTKEASGNEVKAKGTTDSPSCSSRSSHSETINDKDVTSANSARVVSDSGSISSNTKNTFAFSMPKPKALSKTKQKNAFEGNEGSPKERPEKKTDTGPSNKFATESSQSQEKNNTELEAAPALQYNEPSWSGIPTQEYHLEVLKNGAIVSKISLNDKAYHVFGRLESCDVQMDHPSLSRYHLILQYRLAGDSEHDPGFYVYDLGSTHGSFLNKHKLIAKAYYRMTVGHLFKLGGSTRLFILQGPPDEQEPESELSVTELKELRQKQMLEMDEKRRRKEEKEEEMKQKKSQEDKSGGIDWGMGWDQDEEEDDEPDAVNPFAMETQEEREAAYVKDPKKTLRGFFEREDLELEYETDEKGSGYNHQYVCRVELPVDDAMGKPIYAEAAVSGKKKEAVLACALEACRILDAHGVLRQATHESKKRKAKDWAQDDYYDSDDDTYLDRTGLVEKKRKQRMKKAGVIEEKAETYESLTAKLKDVDSELVLTEKQLEEAKKAQPASGGSDSLDDFIASLKAGGSSHDRAQRAKLKLKVVDLRKEQFRLQKLVQLARPADMPESPKPRPVLKGKAVPMIGSMKSRTNFKDRFKPKITFGAITTKKESDVEFQEEVEEDEDEEEKPEQVDDDRQKTGADGEDMETDSHQDKEEKQSATESSSRLVKGPQPPPGWSSSQRKQEEETMSGTRPVKGPQLPPGWSSSQSEQCEKEEESVSGTSSTSKPKRVYGPAMPPPMSEGNRVVKGPARGPSKEDFKQHYGEDVSSHQSVQQKLASRRDNEADYKEEEGEDYSSWQPPKGQKGDGRTRLNEKLGY